MARSKISSHIDVCSYSHFKPVIYDEGKGYEADLLKAIFKKWNVNYTFHPTEDYKDISEKVADVDSPYHIVVAGLDPRSHQGSKSIRFSKPTASYSQSLLIKRKFYDDHQIENYRSFLNTPMKIGVLGNSTGEKFGLTQAKEVGLDSSHFSRYDTENALIEALMKEEVHAIARGTFGNEYLETVNPEVITIEKKSFGETLAYASNIQNKILGDSLDEAIDYFTSDGRISYADWFANPSIFNNK